MSANPLDRASWAAPDRRRADRRGADRVRSERRQRNLRFEDPARLVMWELAMERARAEDRRIVARLRDLIGPR